MIEGILNELFFSFRYLPNRHLLHTYWPLHDYALFYSTKLFPLSFHLLHVSFSVTHVHIYRLHATVFIRYCFYTWDYSKVYIYNKSVYQLYSSFCFPEGIVLRVSYSKIIYYTACPIFPGLNIFSKHKKLKWKFWSMFIRNNPQWTEQTFYKKRNSHHNITAVRLCSVSQLVFHSRLKVLNDFKGWALYQQFQQGEQEIVTGG